MSSMINCDGPYLDVSHNNLISSNITNNHICLFMFVGLRTDNAIKNHWNSSLRKKLYAYIKSGLLEEFKGLPSVVIQSTPTTLGHNNVVKMLMKSQNAVKLQLL